MAKMSALKTVLGDFSYIPYSFQFTSLIPFRFLKCFVLFVTRTDSFSMAKEPMSISSSSIVIPFFLKYAYCLAASSKTDLSFKN